MIELNDGRPPLRIGLHKDVTLGGISYPGGHVFPDFDGDDKGKGADAVKHPQKDCVDVDGVSPCKENQMYKDWSDAPISASGNNYKLLGPNSNTFVSDFLRYFGLVPPPVRIVPGFGK